MELQPGEQWFNDCYYIFIQFKHDYCDCELCEIDEKAEWMHWHSDMHVCDFRSTVDRIYRWPVDTMLRPAWEYSTP